jgi:hypothetical protein
LAEFERLSHFLIAIVSKSVLLILLSQSSRPNFPISHSHYYPAMSEASFSCTEHTVLGQHIRNYPRSTSLSQNDEIHVAVKQYTTRNATPQPGEVDQGESGVKKSINLVMSVSHVKCSTD